MPLEAPAYRMRSCGTLVSPQSVADYQVFLRMEVHYIQKKNLDSAKMSKPLAPCCAYVPGGRILWARQNNRWCEKVLGL